MTTPEVLPDPRRWRALAVLALVQFMLVLDNTVVNVALPSLQRDLGLGPTGLAWVVNGYVVAFGGLLLLGGRLADAAGRRLTYLGGVALFAVASAGCGAAQDGAVLLAGRVLQGVGAALVAPAALSMVTLLFTDPRERARAFSIWGGLAALGGTTGVVISGVLVDLVSWRWIFLINLPVAVVSLLLVPRLVAESRAATRRRPDVGGSVLSTTALVALVDGLLAAGTAGWGRPGTLVPLAVAVAAGVGFVLLERGTADPLVPVSFLRHRRRGLAYGCGLAVMAAFFATFFSLTLYLQDVLGLSPLRAGLAYLPYGLALGAGIAASGALARRVEPERVLVPGLVLGALGVGLLARLPVEGAYAAHVLPGLVVLGVGNGLAIPVITLLALSDVPPPLAGLAGGLQNTVLQVGGAVGLAALVGLGTSHARRLAAAGSGPAAAATAGYARSFAVAAAVLAAAALLALLERTARARRPVDATDHPLVPAAPAGPALPNGDL